MHVWCLGLSWCSVMFIVTAICLEWAYGACDLPVSLRERLWLGMVEKYVLDGSVSGGGPHHWDSEGTPLISNIPAAGVNTLRS